MSLPPDPGTSIKADWPTPPEAPRPARRPAIWSGIGVVVMYFALQVAISVALAFVIGIGYGIVKALQQQPAARGAVQTLFHEPGTKTALTIVTIVVAAALTIWLVHRFWPAMWRVAYPPGLGFARPTSAWFFALAFLIGIVIAPLGGVLTQWLAQGHVVHQDVTVMGREVSLTLRVLLAIVVVIVAPIVEELIFRGALLAGLMRHVHAGWAVLITAILFGCAHLPDFKFAWYAIPILVILGLVLGWIRLRSRSLWPSITLHGANNLIATIGWFVAVAPHH